MDTDLTESTRDLTELLNSGPYDDTPAVVFSEPVKDETLPDSNRREALSERSGEGDLRFKAMNLEGLAK